MVQSYKYWDNCVDEEDMHDMWMQPEVSSEWLEAGESRGQRVHISRDPDGQPYLTQTEMKAVADITCQRHFGSKIDPEMLCAIAELESDRQLLATRYNKKTKEASIGLLQVLPKSATRLILDGYGMYNVEKDADLLHRPFINVYYGAAYLNWLSNYQEVERSEEFIVRAYKGGTKKATHKSTLPYWRRYQSVKDSLPFRKYNDHNPAIETFTASAPASPSSGSEFTYWDSRTSLEDMENMWRRPAVHKEWTKLKQKRGRVRFSQDDCHRPYLSRTELKAVAELILTNYFNTRRVRPSVLCSIAEIVSMRFLNGVEPRVGIMGVDYATASWLYSELNYRAYRVDSPDDLMKPFVSMYFGAAYLAWLSEYEGRERTPEFVFHAYLVGPKNVNLQETGTLWLKFEHALSNYEDLKRDNTSCAIL